VETQQAPNLNVVHREIRSLTPYPRNARTHSRRQIRLIADSIRTFGFTNPVLIDRSGMIIAGHGRVEAAKLLRIEEVPTICLENLSEDQIRAYILADNKLAEKAGWDKSILAIELQYLLAVDLGFDITLTGFEIGEIDLILQDASAAEEKPVEIKTGPAVSQLGDLWLLGKHRISCGSALDPWAYGTLMAGVAADVVFTDPPYNVKIDGNVSGKGAVRHGDFLMGAGEMTDSEFFEFLLGAMRLLSQHSKPSALQFLCMDWRHAEEMLIAGRRTYNALLNLCVWTKDKGAQGSLYRSQHELVFVFRNGAEQHRNNVMLGQYGRNRTNVWKYPGSNTLSKSSEEGNLLALHPTVKPVAMIADAILDCTAPGELVLDPFVGSGSTIIAAERVGRTCYAIELDPLYVDTAVARWQKETGGTAVHAVTGAPFNVEGDR
jgi:DNA modification methylase